MISHSWTSHRKRIMSVTNIWPSVIWLPTKSFPLLTSSEKSGGWWEFLLSPVHCSVNAPVKSLWDRSSWQGQLACRGCLRCDDSAIKHQNDGNRGCTSCPGETNTHYTSGHQHGDHGHQVACKDPWLTWTSVLKITQPAACSLKWQKLKLHIFKNV